jgi:hypothetical protein
MKQVNQLEALTRENHVVKNEVKKLKHSLRFTDLKYKQLLRKAKHAGLQFTDLEFETVDIQEYLETELEKSYDNSLSLNYTDLPMDTETIFE